MENDLMNVDDRDNGYLRGRIVIGYFVQEVMIYGYYER